WPDAPPGPESRPAAISGALLARRSLAGQLFRPAPSANHANLSGGSSQFPQEPLRRVSMGERPATDRSGRRRVRPYIAVAAALALGATGAIGATVASATTSPNVYPGYQAPKAVPASLYVTPKTTTPIQHLVVIFDENETFDHYFGTYPFAA